MKARFSMMLAVVVIAAMVLVACGPSGGGGAAQQPAATTAAQPTTAPAATTAPVDTTAPAATTAITSTTATTTTAPAATTAVTSTTATTTTTTAPAATTAVTSTTATTGTTTGGGATAGGPSVGASEEGARGAGLTFLADAYAGKYKGTTVSMMGPFVADDQVLFEKSVADFQQKTGIKIAYEGTKQFETTIGARSDAGNPPDIADFPQPGLLGNLAASGKILDLKWMNQDWIKKNYSQSWQEMAMKPGKDGKPFQAGIWARFNGKSLVWYPKKAFDAAGYKVPTTWEELQALEQQIISDGDAPWCIGIESGTATGWVVTDWMEDIMLRTTTPENYDKWVAGTLKFESPEVKNAADVMSKIFLDPKMVLGGRAKIVATNFQNAADPMFENPPKCWLHRQGNFITSFFPKTAKSGVDYDFFYLPGIDPKYGKPFLVAGDIYAMFKDRPEVRAVMEFFTTGESIHGWIATGGALAPYNDVPLEWYGNDIERKIAGLVREATTLRFDASDQMPAEVGTGSFWKSMTSYIAGTVDEATALKEIDASWPKK